MLQRQQTRLDTLETALTETVSEVRKLFHVGTHLITVFDLQIDALKQQHIDVDIPASKMQKDNSGSKNPKSQSRYWTTEEHKQFLIGLEKYGARDVKAIASLVGTRNATQVRTHAQKYFLRLQSNDGEDDGLPEKGISSRSSIMSTTVPFRSGDDDDIPSSSSMPTSSGNAMSAGLFPIGQSRYSRERD